MPIMMYKMFLLLLLTCHATRVHAATPEHKQIIKMPGSGTKVILDAGTVDETCVSAETFRSIERRFRQLQERVRELEDLNKWSFHQLNHAVHNGSRE